ncbi:type VII toxin-antitoxin system HepT family RNase toxin [Neobacillus sp. SM06]|uniref:type VII toxin-antitoxin system HepT family RNase toxin n=1 Tax=Neobacillus sp. SM06 TaxID=3422492 RepID=UPI003D2A126C
MEERPYEIFLIAILNIHRACEASIDLAMHVIAEKRLGLPQTSLDAFDILQTHSIIDKNMAKQLKAMVEFRNSAVHDYQAINVNILIQIIEKHLTDFSDYAKKILEF